MELVATLHDVRKTYDLGEVQVHALKGVNFAIRKNDYVAIMGSSGSGKSTLLNILGCLDRPSAGITSWRAKMSASSMMMSSAQFAGNPLASSFSRTT